MRRSRLIGSLILLAIAGAALGYSLYHDYATTKPTPTPEAAKPPTPPTEAAKTEGSMPDTGISVGGEKTEGGSVVKIETTAGTITAELFDKKAPITAGNFLNLAKKGFYDGLTFHRCIPDFMIQGGDPKGNGSGGPGYTIPDEVSDPSLKNVRGALSMAKTEAPNTGGSQFFIVRKDQPHLDGKHSVFGKVLSGQEVVEKITNGVKMTKVSVVKESPDATAAEQKAKAAQKPSLK